MGTLSITFREAGSQSTALYDVERTSVTDCRDSADPSVNLQFDASNAQSRVFLPPDVARRLHHQLSALFPGDAVVRTFEKLFGMELTVTNLDELKGQLMELEGSLADTTEMEPVTLPANTKGEADA